MIGIHLPETFLSPPSRDCWEIYCFSNSYLSYSAPLCTTLRTERTWPLGATTLLSECLLTNYTKLNHTSWFQTMPSVIPQNESTDSHTLTEVLCIPPRLFFCCRYHHFPWGYECLNGWSMRGMSFRTFGHLFFPYIIPIKLVIGLVLSNCSID